MMSTARKFRPSFWIVLAIIVVNAFFFGGRLTAWVADKSGVVLAPVTGWVMRMRNLATTMFSVVGRAKENISLREEILQMRGQLAQYDEMKQQLAFYRAAAAIRERIGVDHIAAGIFAYPQGNGVQQVIINRGEDDWVVEGGVVVTPQSALVGVVERAFEHHATVRVIGDPALDVTARIMGTSVSGLVRVDSAGDVVLDLVQKDEIVTEGSTVITSGDDLYPAGLMIGTVRSVDNTATTLFKIVRITPFVSPDISGKVIIVRP